MLTTILMYVFLVVEVVCCLMLIGVILLQRSRSQGAGLAFGAGMGETLFGAQAGNVLTKTTVVLAVIFLLNTTLLAFLQVRRGVSTRSVADSIESAPARPYVPQSPMGQPMRPDEGSPAAAVPTWPEAGELGEVTVGDGTAPVRVPAGSEPAQPPVEGSDAAPLLPAPPPAPDETSTPDAGVMPSE